MNTQTSQAAQIKELQRLLDDARGTILRQYDEILESKDELIVVRHLLDEARDTILRRHAEIEALSDGQTKADRIYRAGYMAGWNGGLRGDYEEKERVANMVRA